MIIIAQAAGKIFALRVIVLTNSMLLRYNKVVRKAEKTDRRNDKETVFGKENRDRTFGADVAAVACGMHCVAECGNRIVARSLRNVVLFCIACGVVVFCRRESAVFGYRILRAWIQPVYRGG